MADETKYPWTCFHCKKEFSDDMEYSVHKNIGGLPRCEVERIAAQTFNRCFYPDMMNCTPVNRIGWRTFAGFVWQAWKANRSCRKNNCKIRLSVDLPLP